MDTRTRNLKKGTPEYAKEFKSYCGRERVVLRRRRTKLKVDQFHVIAQVGQGGYGEVFLARKRVSLQYIWRFLCLRQITGFWRGLRFEEDEKANTIQNGWGEQLDARVSSCPDCVLLSQVRHVLVERDILTATKTPWLVRLLYAFQDPEYVYLAMEYVPGGDFRTLLNNSGVLKE